MTDDTPPDFESSQLGTQKHWDDAYQKELENFTELGVTGEIWFGEDSQEQVVQWICDKSNLPLSANMIDLGCGNGMLILALREQGYTNLTGVDYSKYSVQLAQKMAESEGVNDLIFEECDVLAPEEANKRRDLYDACLDKGTYDAITLKDPKDPKDRKLYVKHVHSMLKTNGLLILTSCNWTKSELEQHFSHDFVLKDEIPYPIFTFGGQTGQTVTSLIFMRKTHIR